MLRETFALWGPPVAIMALGAVMRVEHRRMTGWISSIERLVRLVILGMALALRLPPLRGHPRVHGKRAKRYAFVWPTRPRTWIAYFRMFPAPRSDARSCRRKRAFISRVIGTQTIALRLEAVVRVVSNPRAYACSAARTLARLADANARANSLRDLHPLLVPRRRDTRTRRDLGQSAAEPAFSRAWAIAAPRIEAFLGRAPDPG